MVTVDWAGAALGKVGFTRSREEDGDAENCERVHDGHCSRWFSLFTAKAFPSRALLSKK